MNQMSPRPKRSLLDRFFFAIATKGWSEQRIASYPSQLQHYSAALTPELLGALQLIDTKVAGLLTHVSLMIAGLGLIAPLVATSELEIGIVIAEIGVYLIIAIGCLRCLSLFSISDFNEQTDQGRHIIVHEMIVRRELYSLCVRAATAFTVVVFLLLPVLYLWKPVQS